MAEPLSDEFALASHQLAAARHPDAPIQALVAAKRTRGGYFIWRDDPELSRLLNDRLAGQAD